MKASSLDRLVALRVEEVDDVYVILGERGGRYYVLELRVSPGEAESRTLVTTSDLGKATRAFERRCTEEAAWRELKGWLDG